MAKSRKTFGPFICSNPYCGKQFYGYRGNLNKYCSKRCNKRKQPLEMRNCERCQTPFLSGANNRKQFCSFRCFTKHKPRPCMICDQLFLSKQGGKYCSRQCFFIARTKTIEERFWAKVDKSGECWLWIGGKNRQGYGTILRGKKTALAHRVAYEFFNGSIEENLLCLHSCDNPSCVNPKHLRLGDQFENMQECVEKGRAGKGYCGMSVRTIIWNKILEFYNHACGLCGSKESLVQDHFIPLSRGGKISWDNVWPLCRSCNQKKRTKILPITMPHLDALRSAING